MSREDIIEALKGIKYIIEKDRYCKVDVIECDADVQKVYKVKRLKDIQFNVVGRGGTTLFPGLEVCKELNCDVVLAFTDGYCDDINSVPKKKLPKKIIWVITNGGSDECINRTGFIVKLKD
jgi:predicted metal-dependent peptidase